MLWALWVSLVANTYSPQLLVWRPTQAVALTLTWTHSMTGAERVLADAVKLAHAGVFGHHVHGLGQQELPAQNSVKGYSRSDRAVFRERLNGSSRAAAYLLVSLSSSSHRSSATRKTDLSLMGREMEWTLPSSTSSTSSWLLLVGVRRSQRSVML